jgi:hypothetical protein
MKKSLLSFLVISLAIFQASAQDYKVIHVNGTIEAQSTHANLARGTSFGEKEKFQYKSNDARAVVINTKKGERYILKGSVADAGYHNASLTPSAGNISSRAGGLNNRLDLMNHFDGKYVILGELKVVINSTAFPMDKNHFFYINYLYKGESINKRLSYNGDTLIINKDSLLRVDGKPIRNEDITEMKLIYYSKENGKITPSVISSTFYPVFPKEEELKQEVEIVTDAMKSKPEDEIVKAIASYIYDVYGKSNKENVAQWYQTNFKSN